MRSVKDIENDLAAKTRELNPLVVRYMDGGLDGDDLATFRRLKADVETLNGELADAKIVEGQRRDDLAFAETAATMHRHYNQPAGNSAARQVPGDGGAHRDENPQQRGGTMGEQFVNSEQFREYRESGIGRGIRSAPFRIDMERLQHRALITSTVVTDVIQPQRLPGIFSPDLPELTLRGALASGRTDTNLIEYVRLASRANNAAEVAEAAALDGVGLTGGVKPESGFTLEPATAPVRTIAHLMYVTRQALDDMSGLQSFIDSELRWGLDDRVNRQLLIGSGIAPNLEGLNVVDGSQDLGGAYYTTTMPHQADRIRRAITQIRLVGRGRASLVVLNPADVEYFELLKTQDETGVTNNQYALPNGGPWGSGAVSTIWGRPIVEHEDQDEGIATVMDGRAAMVMDRMENTVFVTDSNRDLFERNIITVLAETRLAFPIMYPERIAIVDLTATV